MKHLTITLFALVISLAVSAQEALWHRGEVISPEIGGDNSVTVRLAAPSAMKVDVVGDFLAEGRAAMVRGEDGVWEYRSAPLESELYKYRFEVDGITITDPANVYLIRDIARVESVFIVQGGRGDTYSVQDVAHGTVSKRWYHSPTLGTTRRITVYTPAGYEDSKRKYPVLYLLHGMGGDEDAWCELGRAAQILDNLIASGKAREMIFVMTNGNVDLDAAPGHSAEGLVRPTTKLTRTMEGSFERSFGDVMDFVDGNYRTICHAKGRAIAGLSMGGFHALHISRFYPRTFYYVGLFSAAIMPDKERREQTDVYADIESTLCRQRDNGLELYWIACGKDDFLWDKNCEYRALLDSLRFPYTFRESEGGHTWRNWRVYLTEFAQQLFL